jgi:hypothetical protein
VLAVAAGVADSGVSSVVGVIGSVLSSREFQARSEQSPRVRGLRGLVEACGVRQATTGTEVRVP